MRRLAFSGAMVLAFTTLTILLVWALRFFQQSAEVPPAPPSTAWKYFLRVAFPCALMFGITITSRAKGVCWRKAIFEGVFVSLVCTMAFGTGIAFMRSEDAWWPVYSATAGALIGLFAAITDRYVNLKAGGWR
jgi:hypothetical protein